MLGPGAMHGGQGQLTGIYVGSIMGDLVHVFNKKHGHGEIFEGVLFKSKEKVVVIKLGVQDVYKRLHYIFGSNILNYIGRISPSGLNDNHVVLVSETYTCNLLEWNSYCDGGQQAVLNAGLPKSEEALALDLVNQRFQSKGRSTDFGSKLITEVTSGLETYIKEHLEVSDDPQTQKRLKVSDLSPVNIVMKYFHPSLFTFKLMVTKINSSTTNADVREGYISFIRYVLLDGDQENINPVLDDLFRALRGQPRTPP